MKRGDLFRVRRKDAKDPRPARVFAVVSRGVLLESRFSSVVCAPVYSAHEGLATQVPVGVEHGLKHDSSIHCDALVSIPKEALTDFVGTLPLAKLQELRVALMVALDLM